MIYITITTISITIMYDYQFIRLTCLSIRFLMHRGDRHLHCSYGRQYGSSCWNAGRIGLSLEFGVCFVSSSFPIITILIELMIRMVESHSSTASTTTSTSSTTSSTTSKMDEEGDEETRSILTRQFPRLILPGLPSRGK